MGRGAALVFERAGSVQLGNHKHRERRKCTAPNDPGFPCQYPVVPGHRYVAWYSSFMRSVHLHAAVQVYSC